MSQEESLSVFQAAIKNFLGPISEFLADDTISEVMINGPSEIFIERKGKIHKTEAHFRDAEAAQFLDISMYLGKNTLVSGGTG